MKQGIIIFQKNAVLGKVKTRLAASLGDEMALSIYKKLLKRTHQHLESLPMDRLVYFSDYLENEPKDSNQQYFVQPAGNLGQRMIKAFQEQFNQGYDQLLIIGTDCPDITSELVEKAFSALKKNDFVIGPAEDGGYYLLGMNKFSPELFVDIPWSSAAVCEMTKKAILKLNKTYETLPVLSDVDNEEDWGKVKDKF